jgi:hypothetical protein
MSNWPTANRGQSAQQRGTSGFPTGSAATGLGLAGFLAPATQRALDAVQPITRAIPAAVSQTGLLATAGLGLRVASRLVPYAAAAWAVYEAYQLVAPWLRSGSAEGSWIMAATA